MKKKNYKQKKLCKRFFGMFFSLIIFVTSFSIPEINAVAVPVPVTPIPVVPVPNLTGIYDTSNSKVPFIPFIGSPFNLNYTLTDKDGYPVYLIYKDQNGDLQVDYDMFHERANSNLLETEKNGQKFVDMVIFNAAVDLDSSLSTYDKLKLKSKMIDITGNNIKAQTPYYKYLSGSSDETEKESISYLQNNVSFDNKNKTWTVNGQSGSNVYDLLDNIPKEHADYFKKINSQHYYDYLSAKATFDLLDGRLAFAERRLIPYEEFVSKNHNFNYNDYFSNPDVNLVVLASFYDVESNKFLIGMQAIYLPHSDYYKDYSFYLTTSINLSDSNNYDSYKIACYAENKYGNFYDLNKPYYVNDGYAPYISPNVFQIYEYNGFKFKYHQFYPVGKNLKLIDLSYKVVNRYSDVFDYKYFYKATSNLKGVAYVGGFDYLKDNMMSFFGAYVSTDYKRKVYSPVSSLRSVIVPNENINKTVVGTIDVPFSSDNEVFFDDIKSNSYNFIDVYNPDASVVSVPDVNDGVIVPPAPGDVDEKEKVESYPLTWWQSVTKGLTDSLDSVKSSVNSLSDSIASVITAELTASNELRDDLKKNQFNFPDFPKLILSFLMILIALLYLFFELFVFVINIFGIPP